MIEVKQELSTNTKLIFYSSLPHLLVNKGSTRLAILDTFRYSFALDSKGFAGVQFRSPRPKYSS